MHLLHSWRRVGVNHSSSRTCIRLRCRNCTKIKSRWIDGLWNLSELT